MDLTQAQLLASLQARVIAAEAAAAAAKMQAIANKKDIKAVALATRNNVGTISAACLALAINIGVNWLHELAPMPAYEKLMEYERMAATDLGVRVREALDGTQSTRFVAMPQGVVMIGLTPAQTQQYIQTVILTESGGNQRIINPQGYVGIGQFGASALCAVGLVSCQRFRAAMRDGILRGRDGWIGQKEWLTNSANWTIEGGQETFRENLQLQIAAMVKLANINIRSGYTAGALHSSDSPQKHAGFAKAAHLVGAGRAINWYKYRIESTDGNRTRASKYARDGESAVKG